MIDRLLVDLDEDGRVSVGILPNDGQGAVSSTLAWPLGEDRLEDLRWYLEDYLRAPFGVYEDRGQQVASRLPEWGAAIFDAVFGAGPARDAYDRMLTQRQAAEIVFCSSSAALLALPWELTRDPDRPAALALDLAGVSRSPSAIELAETVPVLGGRLRVLIVISRPSGVADAAYRMIARPLLKQLESAPAQVDLVVLRPPTLAALDEMLTAAVAAGEPFHVVHFDGHGASSAFGCGEGVLAFELPGGGRDLVPAFRVARVLAASRVPVIVLNACQSGAVGRDLEASVATRLLQAGAASVVAMAYTVYTVAVAEFMTAFYERLFAGDEVAAAVTAGRLRMSQHNRRPSPKGDMPLADWLVPVHYFRCDVSFPQTRATIAFDHSADTAQELGIGSDDKGNDLGAVGEFVGRDDLFSRLEAATSLHGVVVLYGPAGNGKTELVKAFGRWWRDTGGVDNPAWVFWHSFEPDTASFALDAVIAEIGMKIFGGSFDLTERAKVLDMLVTRKMLLIWDNFECVRSMPDPAQATRPLRDADCHAFREFLGQLGGQARSSVLITSRAPEDWLGDVCRIVVGGLSPHEAAEYAGQLLASHPAAAPRRARRAFAELVEWLGGNPLSMRLILPLLSTTDPEVLLDGLHGTAPLPAGEDPAGGRTASLAASITYSLIHLAPPEYRLLPAICLFQGVADVDLLTSFSQDQSVPERFRVAADQWRAVLDGAAEVGLLTGLGDGMYQIHPALPAYLAIAWRREEGAEYEATRDAAVRALLTASASLAARLTAQAFTTDAGLALKITGIHRGTFGLLLGYALDRKLWMEALAIAQSLNLFWETQGLDGEASAWGDRVFLAVQRSDGGDLPPDDTAGAVWMFFTWTAANRQLRRHQVDKAEHTYHQIVATLRAQPASRLQRQHLAGAYHQLGMIAQDRGRLSEAEDWYKKALTIRKDIGAQRDLTQTYLHLGTIAEHSGKARAARRWYARALSIQHKSAMLPAMAAIYHQLGVLAHRRGRLVQAERWYLLGLHIQQELRSKPGLALTYQQLGMIALDTGRLDAAGKWYSRALAIMNELNDQAGMAAIYHQLGVVAQVTGRLDDAERWYAESLRIATQTGDTTGAAVTSAQLGMIAEQRGKPLDSLEWTIRCVAAFDQFPHPQTEHAPERLGRLSAQLGVTTLESSWRAVTGRTLPPEVRHYADSFRASRKKHRRGTS